MNKAVLQNLPIGILYALPAFLLFSNEVLFRELIPVHGSLLKGLHIIALGMAIWKFQTMNRFMRIWLVVILLYFSFGIYESLYKYNSFFQYPHVYSKITQLFLIFGFYAFYKLFPKKYFSIIIYLILIAFFLNILIFKQNQISVHAFLTVDRALNDSSSYILLLPLLFFFNKFTVTARTVDLILIFILGLFLILVQYRTVWVATGIALLLNIYFINKSVELKFNPGLRLKLFVVFLIILYSVGLTLTYQRDSKALDMLTERAEEILNPTEKGTGSWRYDMFQAYKPYIAEHWFSGMRFEGFELPVQFYKEEIDEQMWEADSGHHFHSLYLDYMFYHGVIGLLLALVPMIYFTYCALRKSTLSTEEIVLTCFLVSGFLFGISYRLPVFYYGILGVGYAFFDLSDKKSEND